ncbi:uncharacterized protein IUM83_02790 [Phytophthora cinnamomi]|uniref:uncharacterized protein n=1 Tax=Phytophthora cinnamomi TaxID=4785 RepID=UPI003559B4F7|nr:hypothetical protein IUM83_02790 [Phytophthora cinnamomi]
MAKAASEYLTLVGSDVMVVAELLEPVLVFLVEDDDLVVPPELLVAAAAPLEVVPEVPSPVLDELVEPLLTTTPTITPTMASTTITPMATRPFRGIAMLYALLLCTTAKVCCPRWEFASELH